MKRFLIFGFTLFLFSCQQSTELPELDLLKYGLAIKINAPEDAEVEANDMGIAKDVSVKSGSDFYIQIVNSNAVEFNAQKLKQAELEQLQTKEYFSKLIQEDDTGFIFEKSFGPDNLNYDFRYFKIQGDQEYKFQAGLIGSFSEEDIRTMYKAVQ